MDNQQITAFSQLASFTRKTNENTEKLPSGSRSEWKLMRVINGHTGWVRSIAVSHCNEWFATGSGDATIKIWDLPTGTLKLTLTGHVTTVRSLAISSRSPYLFSAGDDKMVKCWDLEQNKVVRNYHGHFSGVYSVALHPILDLLITGSRDCTAKLWDIRTKKPVQTFIGHRAAVNNVQVQEIDPQLVTASQDSTIRLWDIVAGKSIAELTHHKKSVRALVLHPTEFAFASASTSSVKKWALPEGKVAGNFSFNRPKGFVHEEIVNTLSLNQDGVLFAGGNAGEMRFWDWESGAALFEATPEMHPIQPGSLEGERGIYCSSFDRTGLRLLTGEADKSIKVWKEESLE
jgi:pleiotropic regulator 1